MLHESYLVSAVDRSAGRGANPTALFRIRVGNADRQWLEVEYLDRTIEPIVDAKIVPAVPDDPNALIDACLLFYPAHFRRCSLLQGVVEDLQGRTEPVRHLDFHLGASGIPKGWQELREQAHPYFEELRIVGSSVET